MDQDSEIQAVDLAVVDLAVHLVEVVEGSIKHSQAYQAINCQNLFEEEEFL